MVVAVKKLKTAWVHIPDGSPFRDELLKQFQQESELLCNLRHKNILMYVSHWRPPHPPHAHAPGYTSVCRCHVPPMPHSPRPHVALGQARSGGYRRAAHVCPAFPAPEAP